MSRRLRHHQPASRRLHDVLGLLVTLLALACLELSFGGPAWGSDRAGSGPVAVEVFGSPASAPQPIALTGPRGLVLIAGLGDGRLRTGQLVEPGGTSFAALGTTLRAGVDDAQARPPFVLTRGQRTVRAPPLRAA